MDRLSTLLIMESGKKYKNNNYISQNLMLFNLHFRDKLAQVKLSRYKEDLLFYLFYTNYGDAIQLAAANEL